MTDTISPAIQVRGIEKSFGDLKVLEGIDLDVERGTILALLGPNGAGKTTLVEVLATLHHPDTGSATVVGFDVVDQAAEVRKSLGLTGQFAATDEVLSGRENLILIARLRHMRQPKAVAEELLDRFDLADAASRPVSTYSGGMRRRLDIAMCLIGDPPILIFDEPTTGLDPQARNEVWRTIAHLAEHGTTILLTTQYLDEAEHLSDRIALLHNGRIIANNTLDELKRLLPPVPVEYVEKKPSLEDVFFALVGGDDHTHPPTSLTTDR